MGIGKRQRRRNGAKEAWWRGHVEAQAKGELSVREYCRRQNLAENSFYAWRRELRLRASEGPAPREALAFTEVIVAPTPAAAAQIEVLIGSRRVAVAPGFDPQTLLAVVQTLEGGAC